MSDVQTATANLAAVAAKATADVDAAKVVAASAVATAATEVDTATSAISGMSSTKKAAIFVGLGIVVLLAVYAALRYFL